MQKKKTKKCKCGCGRDIPKGLRAYYSEACKVKAKKARENKKKWHKQRGITKKKLDKLWSELVRKRDGKCMYCGSTEHLNAHHIYSRSNHAIRWVISNGITLCSKHHTFSSIFSAHKTPVEFVEWLIDKYTQDLIDKIRLMGNMKNDKTHEEWYNHLKKVEEELNG